jgi:SSS family solute:Na+ symporter
LDSGLIIKLIVIIVFLVISALLGVLGWRRTKNAQDFLLGGRKINPIVMALSYGATFISTSAIVGFGGQAGVFGMSLLWLTFLNIFLGIFIAFIFFGKRTRRIGRNLDAHTFPELLGKRFNSKFIQKFSGIIIFVFMPVYTAAVMIGVSKILGKMLIEGIFPALGEQGAYNLALVIFAVIVAAYVIFGGIKGVMYADAFQGVLMLVGMVVLLVMVYTKLGGITSAHQALTDLSQNTAAVEQLKGPPGFTGWTSMPQWFSMNWMIVVTSIVAGVGIGVLAQPQLAVRFMTVKSDREINRAIPIGGIFILFMTGVAFVVGALSNVLFFEKTVQIAQAAAGGTDGIIPVFLNTFTSPWFLTVFLVMMMAAGMSTISSQFHTMGTAAGRDIISSSDLTDKKAQKRGLIASRVGTLITIIVTVLLSFVLPQIWDGAIAIATGLFFGLCGAAFLPMFVGALYAKKMTTAAAVSGLISGFAASLLWMLLFHTKEAKVFGLVNALKGTVETPVHSLSSNMIVQNLDPLFVALTISVIVTIIVQAATKKKQLSSALVAQSFEGVGKQK